jgi:hypothetical protein
MRVISLFGGDHKYSTPKAATFVYFGGRSTARQCVQINWFGKTLSLVVHLLITFLDQTCPSRWNTCCNVSPWASFPLTTGSNATDLGCQRVPAYAVKSASRRQGCFLHCLRYVPPVCSKPLILLACPSWWRAIFSGRSPGVANRGGDPGRVLARERNLHSCRSHENQSTGRESNHNVALLLSILSAAKIPSQVVCWLLVFRIKVAIPNFPVARCYHGRFWSLTYPINLSKDSLLECA